MPLAQSLILMSLKLVPSTLRGSLLRSCGGAVLASALWFILGVATECLALALVADAMGRGVGLHDVLPAVACLAAMGTLAWSAVVFGESLAFLFWRDSVTRPGVPGLRIVQEAFATGAAE